MVEFRILGSLEVLDESGPLALGGQKQRAVLALLLLNPGRVVPTDTLVDQLWGEEPPRTAITSLQNYISQLRKLLPPEMLATRPSGYVLQVRPEQIDAFRFERLLAEAKGGAAAERPARLAEALALWRGPALTDFTFESFSQSEARRLEELRSVALEERIDADLELGRHAEVVGELESLVQENPLRERLRGQLMLALYRSARQAEALHAYQDARRALVEELGIEPGSALQQLHGAILRQESALDPAGASSGSEDSLAEVVRALLAGRLVPALGPGGPLSTVAGRGQIASRLAEAFDCPGEFHGDLARISQYVAVTQGIGPLYDELHAVFTEECEPTPVDRFLAGLPPLLRQHGADHQLVVTSGYGCALEGAFEEAGEEVDLVFFAASGRDRGKFVHRRPDGAEVVIDVANTYGGLSLEERTVILKIYGGADPRPERPRESFVVSEDDYIAYLAQAELANIVPVMLAAKLRRSHFLFFGYPLVEWSLRVFLHRVFGDEPISYRSWAVQPGAGQIQQEFWRKRGVDLYDVPLDEYVGQLERRLRDLVPVQAR